MAALYQPAFFSYSRQDSDWVLRLADDLRAACATAWALDARMRVIPILRSGCRIPLSLVSIQHIDFTTDYARGRARLLEALERKEADLTPKDSAPFAPGRDVIWTRTRTTGEWKAHKLSGVGLRTKSLDKISY